MKKTASLLLWLVLTGTSIPQTLTNVVVCNQTNTTHVVATPTSTVPGVTISFTPLSPNNSLSYVAGGATKAVPVQATTNDPQNLGIDWSCAPAGCGTFSPTHTDSGAVTSYQVPANSCYALQETVSKPPATPTNLIAK